MANDRGDFALETTIYIKFTTVTTTGAPTQLAGSPVVSVYENDDNTQITAGITLTVDEDGVTGLNQLAIAATAANGYEAGKFYDAVITTGTVGGTSVVGYVVGSFTIQATSALRPTTAGRALDVSAGGEAGVDWANVGSPTTSVSLTNTTVATVTTTTTATNLTNFPTTTPTGPVPMLGIVDAGTAQAVAAGTLTLRAAAAFGDNTLAGVTALVHGSTQGYWQAAVIASNVGATDVATMTANFAVTPSGTVTYILIGTPSGSAIAVDLVDGAITSATFAAGAINAAAIADGAIDAATFAAGAIDNAAIASNAIGANEIATGAITNAKFAAGAIDAAAIADGAIDAATFAAGAINAAAIADGAIDAATFAANAITSTVLANDAITAAKVAADVATELTAANATMLGTMGINTTDGVSRIATIDLAVGGAAPSSPIGEAP